MSPPPLLPRRARPPASSPLPLLLSSLHLQPDSARIYIRSPLTSAQSSSSSTVLTTGEGLTTTVWLTSSPTLPLTYSVPAPLASLNIRATVPPQGLCTCHFLCLEPFLQKFAGPLLLPPSGLCLSFQWPLPDCISPHSPPPGPAAFTGPCLVPLGSVCLSVLVCLLLCPPTRLRSMKGGVGSIQAGLDPEPETPGSPHWALDTHLSTEQRKWHRVTCL